MLKFFQDSKYITVDMKCITVPLSLRLCNLFLRPLCKRVEGKVFACPQSCLHCIEH